MRRVVDQVEAMRGRDFSVLITGETGVGKEVVARLIHERSLRVSAPLVDFNCASIPESLMESELFGYEPGAFSGAIKAKPGLFELAHGGTLLLDEVGELPRGAQAKLLRVLDRMPYYRLGGTRKILADVRILAATNQNLEKAVQTGAFRADLYYRIAEIHLRIPPLRERVEDIAPLAAALLADAAPGSRLSADAIRWLERHSWPGNIRELRNAVIAAAMASRSEVVTAEAFHAGAPGPAAPQSRTLDAVERTMIVEALKATGGNRMRAAARLGISRRTLSRKLLAYSTEVGLMAADLTGLDQALRASDADGRDAGTSTVRSPSGIPYPVPES